MSDSQNLNQSSPGSLDPAPPPTSQPLAPTPPTTLVDQNIPAPPATVDDTPSQ